MKNANDVLITNRFQAVDAAQDANATIPSSGGMFSSLKTPVVLGLFACGVSAITIGYQLYQVAQRREVARAKKAEAKKIKDVASGQQPIDADLQAKLKAARTSRGMKT